MVLQSAFRLAAVALGHIPWKPESAILTGSYFHGIRETSDLTLVLRPCCKKATNV